MDGLPTCRHQSTMRTHLSPPVNQIIMCPDLPCDAGHGLKVIIWEQHLQDSKKYDLILLVKILQLMTPKLHLGGEGQFLHSMIFN
uniref:Uncharacterized protein n=1 Tax=Mustela putorius furo TaxID=9669 RepID=M3YMK7_MUSPF